MKLLTVCFILTAVSCLNPLTPVCRTSPLPNLIPISVGESLSINLENIFAGYNIHYVQNSNNHITVKTKFTMNQKSYNSSMNFTSVKLKDHGRFLGVITNNQYTGLAIGTNNDSTGVTIDSYVQVEKIPNLHCYDVDEISSTDGSVHAVIDCAVFVMGQLHYNVFLYVDLKTNKVTSTERITDTFVGYHQITKRRIEVVADPFTRLTYLMRFTLRDGVDQSHMNENYMQVFMMHDSTRPQLIEVIDHTFLSLPSLSIADYQIHLGIIYLLVYNKGIYQIRFTRNQQFEVRSFFQIKMDTTKFRIDQLGFNDDLSVVVANSHFVYQFEWEVTSPPTLIAKYTLIPNSVVEQVFVDFEFVVVSAKSLMEGELIRRLWVFTRRTLSYVNAYNVFPGPIYGPFLIIWEQHGSTLHLFQEYSNYVVKSNLPSLEVSAVDGTLVNTEQEFVVIARSFVDSSHTLECSQKFKFVYVYPNNKTIFRTGLMPTNEVYVDSPDIRASPLAYQFFGSNLTYEVSFTVNGSILPHVYVDKQHKATFNWPPQIKEAEIVYYEMFTQLTRTETKPTAIFGLVQVEQGNETKKNYLTHYIKCGINVLDRDETHTLNCYIILSVSFSMGKILFASQIFDPAERHIAIVFENTPNTVTVYYFWSIGFAVFGSKTYAGDIGNILTSVAISQGKLFCVMEYSKRVDIFLLSQIETRGGPPQNPRPIMTLDSQVMQFFGVQYFSPVQITISKFHFQAIFLKTKNGVLGININEMGFPELLFNVKQPNVNYDFQINHDSLLIISQASTILYGLQTPLRRSAPPLRRQEASTKFKLGEYDQIAADRLFYIVGTNTVIVINPYLSSVSTLYTSVYFPDQIISIDAVDIEDKQVLFIRTLKSISAYVFAQSPNLFVEWPSNQLDFTMNLTAKNTESVSAPYSVKYNVLQSNETAIYPTKDFNATEIKKLGRLPTPLNKTYTVNIPINDSLWFEGNVVAYHLNCADCGKSIKLQNHVQQTRQIVQIKGIFDMQSNYEGIFIQQYSALFKTYRQNDSVHYIVKIPTRANGEACSKVAVGELNEYVISLCEHNQVNVYITSLVSHKPFVMGPFPTEAKRVNKAMIVGDILMIVDNDDNPFLRAGGIYLYKLSFDIDDDFQLTLLDYLDYADLQIEGFSGVPYIGSADLHQPFFDAPNTYKLFISQGRTGSIFVFSFQLSPDSQEIVYYSQKWVPLSKLIPTEVKYPTPLRVLTVTVHYFIQHALKSLEYFLILTVSNWHHIELMITLDVADNILFFKLQRLFERFPWKLENYMKFKRGTYYESYFAVPYIDQENRRQIAAVYPIPFIINQQAQEYSSKYSPHSYKMIAGVPLLSMIGAHHVNDTFEISFDFHTFGSDKLLFTDTDGINITELTINRNLTLAVTNLTTPKENITFTAFNPFTNYTFAIEIDFTKIPDVVPDDGGDTQLYLWIGIVVIGALMIIGLIVAWMRQSRKERDLRNRTEIGQSLITESVVSVEEREEVREGNELNRQSADPDSVRDSAAIN